jgi:hypothetical protein
MIHTKAMEEFKEEVTINLENILACKMNLFSLQNFPYRKELHAVTQIYGLLDIVAEKSKKMPEYNSGFNKCVTILEELFPSEANLVEMKAVNLLSFNYMNNLFCYVHIIDCLNLNQDALPQYVILKNQQDAKLAITKTIYKIPTTGNLLQLKNDMNLLKIELDEVKKNYLYKANKTYYISKSNVSGGHSR